ncbi:MAG: hypothetical protein AAGA74_19555 [Pseudomonadota bacterium]
MPREFGSTEFHRAVEPGNAASEAVCNKLGLRAKGSRFTTVVDPSQMPDGQITK